MDYGSLIARTWQNVSTKRFLLALGMLAVIAPGAGVIGADLIIEPLLNPSFNQLIEMQMRETQGINPSQMELIGEMLRLVLIGMGCSILVMGLIFWANSRIAEGGLIASVSQLASGQASGFGQGWMAGARKASQLVVIGLILLVPTFLLSLALYVLNALLAVQSSPQSFGLQAEPDLRATAVSLGFTCLYVVIFIPLYLVRTLAERACVLENKLIGASFQRGLEIFRTQPGPVLMVFLIEIGARLIFILAVGGLFCAVGFAVTLFAAASQSLQVLGSLTSIILCCFTPPLLVVGGIMQSYSSSLWTLAWLGWTSPQQADAPSLTS